MNAISTLLFSIIPEEFLTGIVGQFASFADNIFGALFIALAGWIIARLGSRLILKLLKRINIDKWVESLNNIDFLQKANITVKPSIIFSKFFYYFILIIFLVAATETLGLDSVSDLLKQFTEALPNFIAALIVLIVGLLISNGVKNLVLTTTKSLGISSASFISNFLFFFLVINVLVVALDQIQVPTEFLNSNLTLILGGIVLAFSFGYGVASKDVMSNFLASYYTRNKFKVGDMVILDGEQGMIVLTDGASVTLQKPNGHRVIIPLSLLTTKKIVIVQSNKPSAQPKDSEEE